MNHHEVEVELPIVELPAAVAAAAESWGAQWTADGPDGSGGRLILPVVFGLRRGVMVGRIEWRPAGAGSRVVWNLDESHLQIQRASVAVLGFTVLAILPALAWPFQPRLLALLPFAAMMALLAWWGVLSRLETSGPEEFFTTLQSPSPPAA
ncbi:MAG: hypothetical protein ABI639_09725 [Thermoanaerobaculia bacterium]